MSRPPLFRYLATSCATALLGCTLAVHAQSTSTGQPASPATNANTPGMQGKAASSTLDRGDRSFVEKAAAGGMMEVALGKLASQQAADAQVKAFGERMMQDHGKANDELMKIVAAKGVQVPQMSTTSHQMDADRLGKLQGAEFDRAYMKHMVDDHKKDVSDFQKAAKGAKDPEVKDFATRTLPVLQQHLQLAQTTYDAVRSNRGTGNAAAPGRAASR